MISSGLPAATATAARVFIFLTPHPKIRTKFQVCNLDAGGKRNIGNGRTPRQIQKRPNFSPAVDAYPAGALFVASALKHEKPIRKENHPAACLDLPGLPRTNS
jgi:hypothetical protein